MISTVSLIKRFINVWISWPSLFVVKISILVIQFLDSFFLSSSFVSKMEFFLFYDNQKNVLLSLTPQFHPFMPFTQATFWTLNRWEVDKSLANNSLRRLSSDEAFGTKMVNGASKVAGINGKSWNICSISMRRAKQQTPTESIINTPPRANDTYQAFKALLPIL